MEFDVVILGFGTSGFFLAFELIKAGFKVAVIEKEDTIGGALVNSLIFPTAGFHTLNGKLVITDSVKEFLDFCIKNGLSKGHIKDPLNFSYSITPINPIAYNVFFIHYFFDNFKNNFVLFSNSRIENIYEKNGIIRYIVINYNNERIKIKGKFFVDASGILELSNYIDIKYRIDIDNLQAATLIFKISNVNFSKIIDYIKQNKQDFYDKTDINLIVNNNFLSVSGYFELAAKYLFNKELFLSRDRFLFFGDISKNYVYVNTSRIFIKDIINFILNNNDDLKKKGFFKKCSTFILPSNEKNITLNDILRNYDLIERIGYYLAFKQVNYIYSVMKKFIDGFENSYINMVAVKLGIRQYKILKGLYQLTMEDVISGKDFDDKIAVGTWPIDIHIKDKIVEKKVNENGYFIPFRTLITNNYRNLIFIGKHISSDDYAFSSLRIQATCMNLGSVVGKILVNLLKNKTFILDIDFSLIKKIFKNTFLTIY
ncbi:MAG: FAD-dependent oxidoreductase [bacterium]|nr:FAD-dependent oxidoreductase [bacterium]